MARAAKPANIRPRNEQARALCGFTGLGHNGGVGEAGGSRPRLPMDRRVFLAATAAACLASDVRAQAPGAFRRFGAALDYSTQRDGAAVLIARNGVVLAEDYPGGAPTARWRIGEGTRVFAPLLAASLVADRMLNLDEPVAMTLGDWGMHPVKSTISVRALLNGTSGLAFGRRGGDSVADALALEPMAQPGQRFTTDSAPYLIFGEVARRKLMAAGRTQADPAAYFTSRTLLPIGCVPIGWQRGADGAARFDDGALVSARGWAQAGELLRREGIWRGANLVDDAVTREARLGTFAEAAVGMGLYLASAGRVRDPPLDSDLWRMNPPAPLDLVMAAGDGGQRLYVIPSRNMVIARMARTLTPRRDWSDSMFLALIFGAT